MRRIRAVIFDMDGVLIDSEPFWRQAMTEIVSRAGIPYTERDARTTQGMRIGEITRLIAERHPEQGVGAEVLERDICLRVSELVLSHGRVMPGIDRVLDFVSRNGLNLGLATSTPASVARDFIRRIGIADRLDAVCTGDEVCRGKPDPEIYRLCARRLGIAPEEALVFEDSVSGVRAAKAAGCRCIAVPDTEGFDDSRYEAADLRIRSLEDFDEKTVL